MAYPTLAAFLNRLSPPTATGCLEWAGPRNNGGYGVITYWDSAMHKRRSMGAHRMSHLLHFPGIAITDIVMHACDNPACCNPEHLVHGTQTDTAQDMLAKGRHSRTRKFAPRQRKLTDEQVRAIRHLAATTDYSDMRISLLFGVADTYIRPIRLRQRKAHVSDDGPMAPIPDL